MLGPCSPTEGSARVLSKGRVYKMSKTGAKPHEVWSSIAASMMSLCSQWDAEWFWALHTDSAWRIHTEQWLFALCESGPVLIVTRSLFNFNVLVFIFTVLQNDFNNFTFSFNIYTYVYLADAFVWSDIQVWQIAHYKDMSVKISAWHRCDKAQLPMNVQTQVWIKLHNAIQTEQEHNKVTNQINKVQRTFRITFNWIRKLLNQFRH